MSDNTQATLSEKQLFDFFTTLPIKHTTSFGAVVVHYMPEDMLRDGGSYGELEDATDMLSEYIKNDEEPEDALDRLAGSLEAYADQLRTVRCDFRHYKTKHRVEPNLPSEQPIDPEAAKAWEAAWEQHDNNPTYHAPLATEGKAA